MKYENGIDFDLTDEERNEIKNLEITNMSEVKWEQTKQEEVSKLKQMLLEVLGG